MRTSADRPRLDADAIEDLAAALYHGRRFRLGGWNHASERTRRRYRATTRDALLGAGLVEPDGPLTEVEGSGPCQD